jgi:hypothetical protein
MADRRARIPSLSCRGTLYAFDRRFHVVIYVPDARHGSSRDCEINPNYPCLGFGARRINRNECHIATFLNLSDLKSGNIFK